jgi:hypothetical protein
MTRTFPVYIGGPKHNEKIYAVERNQRRIRIPIMDDIPVEVEVLITDSVPYHIVEYKIEQFVYGDVLLNVWVYDPYRPWDSQDLEYLLIKTMMDRAGCIYE